MRLAQLTRGLLTLPLAAACTRSIGDTPAIATTGHSELHLPADWASITIAAEARGATAEQATQANAPIAGRILDTLRTLGVADATRTVTFGVESNYDNEHGNKPNGYTASTSITLRLRALDRLAAMLDASLGAGATRIAEVQFYSDSVDAGRRRAFQGAVAAARLDATAIAGAAGGHLGTLLNVSTKPEFGGGPYRLDEMQVSRSSQAPRIPDIRRDVVVTAGVQASWAFVSGQ